MTNPGRLLPVLFFSLLSFWPSFCFSDFLISTIHYPLLVCGPTCSVHDFCHTSWRCGFRSSNDLEERPKVTFPKIDAFASIPALTFSRYVFARFHHGHDSIRAENSTVLRRGKAVKLRYCPATVR